MEKPKEIIELEKNYNIILSSQNKEYLITHPRNQNCYELNENMELIGLNLSGNKISDISPLSNLTKLILLDIEENEIDDISSLSLLTSLTYLNCNNNIISDILVLANLTELKHLTLWNNKISDISILINLKQLIHLSLWSNYISDISAINHLRQLRYLDLDQNKISDIKALKNLTKLTTLYLNDNEISNISVLQNLVIIRNLYLANNNISEISILEYLTQLNTLNLSTNKISDYSIINNLNSLTALYLSDNLIFNISFINNLKSLTNLNLSNNKISEITILKELPQITHLNLENNQITNIYALKDLTKLVYINLKENQITDIRPLLTLIQNDIPLNIKNQYSGLNIEQNPLEFPPLQTIKDGNKAIIRFFEKIDKEGTDTIYEAKVTLVGEGSAGKTSLLKRLLNAKEKLPEEKNRTRGIAIADWEFKKQINKRHIAHIWDFGGQDVYYPVHRFFLTENSVFVLLASSRQNTHHFDYWIPTIYQFGGKSPIILGQTCHDGNTTPWNDIGAYIANENFNIIKDHEQNYHEINLPNKNKGLIQIKKSIVNQILNLPHYKKSVPKSWIPVREIINNLKENNCITYIDLKEKIKLSNPQSFVNKEDIEDCLRFFHSIGIILWYHKETKLKNWVILNPKWSVDAVYKIIDDDKVSNQKGIIFSSDFERVWNETIYEDKHDILKDMLEVFKIAFPKKHNKLDYIMPTRLQSIPSESIWLDSESCLRIEYQYEFMPKGLVNQISAELSRYIIDDEQVWNNGVNFCDEETTCQVFENFYHRKITIKAKGKDARSIIMIVMNAVKDITDGYKGVIPKIIIPCVCTKCLTKKDATTFSYEMLLEKIKEKVESKVFCNISEEVFKVEELLYNIGLPNPIKEIRDEIEKMEKMKEEKSTPIKVFVTYSWTDENEKFDEANQNKTGLFVKQLRTKWSLDASFDLYKEEDNFVKMMYENLSNNDKIIIILTKGYVVKADKFKGGVGTEYERIINDIKQNPKKYILVSFEKRSDVLYPFGFQGSDVIEINSELVCDNLPDSQNRLLSKLTDEPLVEIPELNGKTPKVTKKIF
nr:COR domain-containing protein [uncultured Flavobacterium sp.]